MDELTGLEDAEFFFQKGSNILMLEGKWDRAIPYFTKAIQLKSDYSEAYIERGWCNRQVQNFEAALEDFSKAIELNNTGAYANRGDLHYFMGNFLLSLKDFDKVIELETDISKTNTYESRGSAKAKLNDFKGAIFDFTKVIENKTTNGYILPES